MSMQQQLNRFHPLPVIGHPDAFYVKHIKQAEESGNVHERESHKVGRYVTLAMDPKMSWDEKVRHFRHALKHHCNAPPDATPDMMHFYGKLGDLVRRHAGQEAIRLVSRETESYRLRLLKGTPRANLQVEALELRQRVFGDFDARPNWISEEAWTQIEKMLKDWR